VHDEPPPWNWKVNLYFPLRTDAMFFCHENEFVKI
jgi:hypothetical protein